jgi:hypothetical protein
LRSPICHLARRETQTALLRRETAIVNHILWAITPLFMLLTVSSPLLAQKPNGSNAEKYLIRYSLHAGDLLRYEVTHVAKTKTRVRGSEEISQVHTVSQRHWDVIDVSDSAIIFKHVIDAVEMTQQQDDAEEIRWDSQSGDKPPAVFGKVAEQIGQTLATITIDPRGEELERDEQGGTKASLGMGSIAPAFPEEPIAVGDSWPVFREVKARTQEGEVKRIKIRELYTLEKVKTGVATLSLRSTHLTPIRDESLRAQVIQQLNKGTIRFDIDNGRLLSKQLDWDETVVGFQGANSLMEYRARFTEELIDDVQRTAARR